MNVTDYADTSWMSHGNCAHRDPAMFFPSDGVGVEIARRACEGCPVMSQCLEYAIAERIDHGVWGGCSERERRRIIRSRQADANAARKAVERPVSVG